MTIIEKLVLFLIDILGLGAFLYYANINDKEEEKYWASKHKIIELDSSAFPINVQSVNKRRGALIINDSLSIFEYFSSGRDTMGFHDFLEVEDKFSYSQTEDIIRVYRDTNMYVFPKYIEKD